MLRDRPVDFFNKAEYPGNSPNLDPSENIGAIVKDCVESNMIHEPAQQRYTRETLLRNMEEVVTEMEFATGLFEKLLLSYTSRLDVLRLPNGGHTGY